jgi:cytochrome b involved in lipid metabolism
VTPETLKQHNKRDDAWTAINGKVYDVTAYIPYHPGGEKELMRVAGRDGTKLFGERARVQRTVWTHVYSPALTHAWVSAEMMLDTCMVGLYVPG